MARFSIALIFLTLVGCSTQPAHMFGNAETLAKDVSVQELLGSPDVFDGKEVRVIGVAKFDFRFEGVSALYTSKDDLSYGTFSLVGIASFDTELTKHKASFAKLTGKFVLVEGVFHAVPKNWGTVCIGTCWPAGYLSNVNRVQAW